MSLFATPYTNTKLLRKDADFIKEQLANVAKLKAEPSEANYHMVSGVFANAGYENFELARKNLTENKEHKAIRDEIYINMDEVTWELHVQSKVSGSPEFAASEKKHWDAQWRLWNAAHLRVLPPQDKDKKEAPPLPSRPPSPAMSEDDNYIKPVSKAEKKRKARKLKETIPTGVASIDIANLDHGEGKVDFENRAFTPGGRVIEYAWQKERTAPFINNKRVTLAEALGKGKDDVQWKVTIEEQFIELGSANSTFLKIALDNHLLPKKVVNKLAEKLLDVQTELKAPSEAQILEREGGESMIAIAKVAYYWAQCEKLMSSDKLKSKVDVIGSYFDYIIDIPVKDKARVASVIHSWVKKAVREESELKAINGVLYGIKRGFFQVWKPGTTRDEMLEFGKPQGVALFGDEYEAVKDCWLASPLGKFEVRPKKGNLVAQFNTATKNAARKAKAVAVATKSRTFLGWFAFTNAFWKAEEEKSDRAAITGSRYKWLQLKFQSLKDATRAGYDKIVEDAPTTGTIWERVKGWFTIPETATEKYTGFVGRLKAWTLFPFYKEEEVVLVPPTENTAGRSETVVKPRWLIASLLALPGKVKTSFEASVKYVGALFNDSVT